MGAHSPQEAIGQLAQAVNRGDLEAAVALYEPGATFVAEPGQLAAGTAAIRAALAGFINLKPTLTIGKSAVVEAGDVALLCSTWSLSGTAPGGIPVSMGGTSADIVRRRADGQWRIAVDNPWGTAILTG